MTPVFFADANVLRTWLAAHAATATELLVARLMQACAAGTRLS